MNAAFAKHVEVGVDCITLDLSTEAWAAQHAFGLGEQPRTHGASTRPSVDDTAPVTRPSHTYSSTTRSLISLTAVATISLLRVARWRRRCCAGPSRITTGPSP